MARARRGRAELAALVGKQRDELHNAGQLAYVLAFEYNQLLDGALTFALHLADRLELGSEARDELEQDLKRLRQQAWELTQQALAFKHRVSEERGNE